MRFHEREPKLLRRGTRGVRIRCLAVAAGRPSRSQVQCPAQHSAVEPDRVLHIPLVWQLAALAEVVDQRSRAAEQFGNLGSRRATPGEFADGGVAHAGHMKLENPREDSWNRRPDPSRETRVRSQDRGASCTLLKDRECRAGSLPRRRSPVRTRCSAPIFTRLAVQAGLFLRWRGMKSALTRSPAQGAP